MIKQINKLRTELDKELKAASEAYEKAPQKEVATHKAVQALFNNMGLLNDVTCRSLEIALYNRELLQVLTSWMDDQNKLLSATKGRLDVFGPPKL